MECKVMRLADIVPAEYNPRVTLTEADFEYKALKASIDEFGLVVPLVVNERTGTLVSGHQRLNVMLKNGVEETEVVVVDMEPEKEKALCIAMNKVGGQWDYGLLADIMEELRNSEIDTTAKHLCRVKGNSRTGTTGCQGRNYTELQGFHTDSRRNQRGYRLGFSNK